MSPERLARKVLDLEDEVADLKKQIKALAVRLHMAFQTPS